MGEVYLAEDTLLGREVALKRLLPIFAEDADFVARFKREARAISRLTHPGLVIVHSLDWVNGVLLLDMEYVRGTSLLRILQDSVVTPQLTARLAQDVLDALIECHEQGIVHRDIKPSNILFDEAMRAKLVDFGIATALADSTATQLVEGRSTTVVLGTPRFMPPEAWDGAEVTPQWDLFALGVVLYECLTGEAAYKGTTTSALAKQITNDPLARIESRAPKASAQLARVVNRLVLIDPAQRYATAREALGDLAGAPELDGTSSGTTLRRSTRKTVARVLKGTRGVGPRSRPGSVRTWRRGAAIVFAMAILVGGAGYLYANPGFGSSPTAPAGGADLSAAPSLSPIATADRFFVATDLDATNGDSWRWWIAPNPEGAGSVVTGYSSQFLCRMVMTEGPGGLRFAGEWAGYTSPLARGFEQGPVTGGGRWQEGKSGLAARLSFESANQHTVREQSFLAESDPGAASRVDFLRGFEASDLMPALVFNEMAARDLPLGGIFEALVPASGERVIAPLVNETAAPKIDGVLDDVTWKDEMYDSRGRVGELMASPGARALFRRTPAGLYIGVRVNLTGEDPVRASLGIMDGVTHPPHLARRGFVEFSGTEISSRSYFDGEREVPFPEGWQVAAAKGAAEWTLEIFVPAGAPSAPWRFNLQVRAEESAGAGRPLAHWGAASTDELVHGALIVFDQVQR